MIIPRPRPPAKPLAQKHSASSLDTPHRVCYSIPTKTRCGFLQHCYFSPHNRANAWLCGFFVPFLPAISHHVSTFLSIKQHANLCPRSLHINFRLSPYPAKSHRLVGCFNSKSYNTAHICHFVFRQYRIILSADTASEVRQLLSQKRR